MRVVDTNVLLVANGDHDGVSSDCRKQCVLRLLQLQRTGVVVIDDGYRILTEYHKKTSPNQPMGVGDVFLKWILQNHSNTSRVSKVTLTELAPNEFAEFPDCELASEFDPPDRKFVAVANAHADKPPIVQATDSKWVKWWPELAKHGIEVEFPCATDIAAFFAAKFPGEEPTLP
jgi:hypothetical protein